MSKAQEITATMAIALAMAHEHGGRLVRYVGGFWSWEKAPRDHHGRPVDYVGTPTIEGLVKRGRLQYSEWKQGARFTFPIVAELAPDESQALAEEACDNDH